MPSKKTSLIPCDKKTIVDRFNTKLVCQKGQSVVPDIMIRPDLRCPPFMSHRCESCKCGSGVGLSFWPPYKCLRPPGTPYIRSWTIIGNCAVLSGKDYEGCGFANYAPPPPGFNTPACVSNGVVIKWSKTIVKLSPYEYKPSANSTENTQG